MNEIERLRALYEAYLATGTGARRADLYEAAFVALPRLLDVAEAARDEETCRNCEGSGRLYADGLAHYVSEGAPTRACGACDGEGRVFDVDALRAAVERLDGAS